MIRINRLNAGLILFKQILLKWDLQNYKNCNRELGINIKRILEIMFNIIRLQKNYLKSNSETISWIQERFKLNF